MILDTEIYIYPENIYRYYPTKGEFLVFFVDWYIDYVNQGIPNFAMLYDYLSSVGFQGDQEPAVKELDIVLTNFSALNSVLRDQLNQVAMIKQGSTTIATTVDHFSEGGRYVSII